MKLGSKNTDQRIVVVAEVGNNHEGNFDNARKLVEEAARAGADAVKFQTFKTEQFVRRADTVRFNQLKKFELSGAQFAELSKLARSLKLLFISTPLDMDSVGILEPLVDAFKVASGDNNFYPMIARIANTGKPLIISTGASDMDQVERSVQFIQSHWAKKNIAGELGVLHCVTSYPVPNENANLKSIPFLIKKLGGTIGYSDHTLSDDAAVMAVALSARIIEKHFTLDKNFSEFRDHKISVDPAGLQSLVTRIRNAEPLLGTFDKRIQPCEEPLIPVIRRSIVAASDLPAGHRIGLTDLSWVRPSGDLNPGDEAKLIGKVLRRAVQSGESLKISDAS